MNPLKNYRNNIFPQNGEDGVLSELLTRLGLDSLSITSAPLWCVEFGAWDGKHFSNTFSLVKERGWNAVYIEGDNNKYNDLQRTCEEYPSILPVNAYVAHSHGMQGMLLDTLLSDTPVPKNFEILSIDIDSDDLAVWDSLSLYRPKIVLIEINSEIPPGIFLWNSVCGKGNSFSSTLSVAKEKEYSLVCHTGNMVFVRDDLLSEVGLDPAFLTHPELLFEPSWYLSTFTLPTGAKPFTQRMAGRLMSYFR